MRDILKKISSLAILLNEIDLTSEQINSQLIGEKGATDDEILEAEKRLKIKLPSDYINFIKASNGFPSPMPSIEPSFMPISKIDYLKVLDENKGEIWSEYGVNEEDEKLATSILVAGFEEEQYFLLIPPNSQNSNWEYWKFANWIPGEEIYPSLEEYFKSVISFLEKETKDLKTQNPKFVNDYSLRDAFFNSDWNKALTIAINFIANDTNYVYFNGTDLFILMLVATAKTNKFEYTKEILQKFKKDTAKGLYKSNGYMKFDYLMDRCIEACEAKHGYLKNMQESNEPKTRVNPMRIEEIEEQIRRCRKDLLKEKYKLQKIDYILYFLFEYGSSTDFFELYEKYQNERLYMNSHLKAAILYAINGGKEDAQKSLKLYYNTEFGFFPLIPFTVEKLSSIMEPDFLIAIAKQHTI